MFPVRRLALDGLEAWNQVVERGYEGYVAKDEGSQYEGGVRSRLDGEPADLGQSAGPDGSPYLGTIWIWFLILS